MTRYGARIEWRGNSCSVSQCETREAAIVEVVAMARRAGWGPRRWWEFWRWPEPSYAHFVKIAEDNPA